MTELDDDFKCSPWCPMTCCCRKENECRYNECKLCNADNDEDFTQADVNRHCNQALQRAVRKERFCRNKMQLFVLTFYTSFPSWSIEGEPHQTYRMMLFNWIAKIMEKNSTLLKWSEESGFEDDIVEDSPWLGITFTLKNNELKMSDIIRYVKE